jgi:hypothetical protein
MSNNLLISVHESTLETFLSIDGKKIDGIIGFEFSSDINLNMPTLHILMCNPATLTSEDLKKSIESDIKKLKALPYVDLIIQELPNG